MSVEFEDKSSSCRSIGRLFESAISVYACGENPVGTDDSGEYLVSLVCFGFVARRISSQNTGGVFQWACYRGIVLANEVVNIGHLLSVIMCAAGRNRLF
jgi:hypothetical protein